MYRPGHIVEIEGDGPTPQSAVVIWADDLGRQVRIVTERGREQKLAAAKVLLDSGQRVSSLGKAPDQLGAEVRKFARDADDAARNVDVQMVWELCLEDAAAEFGVETLSELAFSEVGGLQRVAMLRALSGDSLYFRRHGTSFAPRPRNAVEETLRQRRLATERATARDALVEWLRANVARGAAAASSGGPVPVVSPASAPAGAEHWLTALDTLACGGELQGALADEVAELVRQLDPGGGGGPDEAALRVMQGAGLIGADENLALRRHHLPIEFGAAAVAHAERSAQRVATLDADPDGLVRRDLRAQPCFTIDSADTTEIDDALAVEPREGGGHRVFIHISDVAFFVDRDDPVDREAQRRSTALYLPERRVAMIPAAIGEEAATLRAGVDRPTLTFVVDVDADGAPVGFEYFTALVRVARRLTYDEADAILAGAEDPVGSALRTLGAIARQLVLARVARGGVILRGLEIEPRLGPDGTLHLVKHDAESAARLTVSELMILAGAQTAEHFRAAGLPGVFRRQAEPEEPLPPLGPDAPYRPELLYELRRKLKPTDVDVRPGRHSTLGLDAYTQVTSPIRRYQDLVMHRQLRARLRGEGPAYSVEALREVAATTEQAGRVARQIEQASDQYWLLKHLGGRRGAFLEAVVVRVDRARTFVELCDYGLTLPIPLTPTHRAGERLVLEVRKAHPRRGTALFQEVGGRDAD